MPGPKGFDALDLILDNVPGKKGTFRLLALFSSAGSEEYELRFLESMTADMTPTTIFFFDDEDRYEIMIIYVVTKKRGCSAL